MLVLAGSSEIGIEQVKWKIGTKSYVEEEFVCNE